MRTIFGKIRLRREVDSIKFTYWALVVVVLLSCLLDFFYKFDFFVSLVEFIFLIVFFRFFHKVIRELYYSYWTFAAFTFLYLFHGLWMALTVIEHTTIFYLNTLGILFLASQAYILNSPIYFPIVNWWEYDFRFRDELNAKIKHKDQTYVARLTDLRRKMGCIVLFEELELGEVVTLEIDNFESIGELTVEVMSKRLYSAGRPYNYGVRFVFHEDSDDKIYSHLTRIWKTEHRSKLNLKYNR